VAVALVTVEGLLAGLLATGIALQAVGWVTVAMLIVFAGALACVRARGATRIPCACFGATAERPTWLLIARAVALATAALPLALGRGIPAGREGWQSIVGAALVVSVVVLGALVVALYRQVGVLLLRSGPRAALELANEGPVLGQAAPPLSTLTRQGMELVAFRTAACRLCAELMPGLRAAMHRRGSLLTVEEADEPQTFAAWRVPGTPFVACVIDGVVVAKGLVNTLEQVEGLIEAALLRAERRAKRSSA
jgi:Thioredoxin domain/Methylamine utilisation protein MauE